MNNNQQNINHWDLMVKVLLSEADEFEIKKLDSWLNQSKKNRDLFLNVKNDIDLLYHNKRQLNINTNEVWNGLFNKLEKDNLLDRKSLNKKIYFIRPFLKIAATIIILLGIGFSLFRYFSPDILNKRTNSKEINEFILSDGSQVFLNVKSSLEYPSIFKEDTREIKFSGEAFFNISKDIKRPFVIQVPNAGIMVLGTSFNVSTKKNNTVEVFVKTGKVALYNKENPKEKIIIEPGYIGRCKNGYLSKETNKDINILSWKSKELFFKETPLDNVFRTIEHTFNIEIDDSLISTNSKKLTSSFKSKNLATVLRSICLTFNLSYEKQGEKIIIKSL